MGYLPPLKRDSAADPFLVEYLPACLPLRAICAIATAIGPVMSTKIAVLNREEGIGNPLDLLHPA